MINPALDGWVWAVAGLFLALMAARAWVVETGHARLGRTTTAVKALTGGTVATLVVLAGLLAVQGGTLLVESIVTKTDPSAAYYATIPDDTAPTATPAAPGG